MVKSAIVPQGPTSKSELSKIWQHGRLPLCRVSGASGTAGGH